VVDFLTLARTARDAGDVPAELLVVDLVDLLEEVASTWHTLARDRGIDLGFEAEPAEIVGVRWQLLELLGNLIDNAMRHGAAHGTVTVRSGRAASGAPFLEVEDDGPGIPEAERDHVFERFFRGAGTADQAGSGLGLAIVRSVAERHAATITLATGAAGHGLRVRLDFAHPDA
jgi:two-component system sensor histidine kinase TctE